MYITSSHGHTSAGVEIDYKPPIGYQGVNLNALGLYKDLLISLRTLSLSPCLDMILNQKKKNPLLERIIFTSNISSTIILQTNPKR